MEKNWLNEINARLEQSLHHDPRRSSQLREAMAYVVLNPGKRLRAILVLESAVATRGSFSIEQALEAAFPAALAIEYVHNYSLIHDDLPAMDDDPMRRGKPSCHVAFDEATAILAGDALLSDAFCLIAQAPYQVAAQCQELAYAIGSFGMVSGQMEDLLAQNNQSHVSWLQICLQKTGRLMGCACAVGALAVGAQPEDVAALRQFGEYFGLAFQIKDDLIDEEPQKGQVHFTQDELKHLVAIQTEKAIQHLEGLAERAGRLVAFAQKSLLKQK